MAWTHFKLTEFGQRTTAKVNGILAVIGVWYPKTDVLTIEANEPNHLGVPFDSLKYKVTDGTEESNIANLTINKNPDLLVNPESLNQSVNVSENSIYNIINNIPYSNGVDRIKIISFENIGELKLENNFIYPNYTIMHYDFENITFKTGLGTGEPYQKIYYQVGNSQGFNPTIYELDYNIIGLGLIQKITEENGTNINMPDSPDIRYLESDFSVLNARSLGIANIEINVDLSPSAWPISTNNYLTLSFNSQTIDRQANGIENILINLDNNGVCDFNLELGFDTNDLPITGTITFTLLDINGDPLLVNGTSNTITYNINF